MNCPKCGTPAAAGAPNCRRCGAALTAKAAASSSDEIDLLPMEPAKAPAHSEFEPPPEIFKGAPPPPPKAKAEKVAWDPSQPLPESAKGKIRGSMASPAKSKMSLIIGGVLALIAVAAIGFFLFRTKHEVVSGKAKVEFSSMLPPNQPRLENLQISGKLNYTLEVNAPDGDINVGIFKRSPKDPAALPALKKLPEGFETVKKGETRNLSGEFLAGQYSWVVVNEGKKPARAKVKFNVAP